MKSVLFCLALFLPLSSVAENIWCGGKLLGVYVSSAGDLTIKGEWRNDWTKICNVKSDPAVDTVTCSLWASYAASAVNNNISVLLMYSSGVTQCPLIPTYNSAPVPYYFMLTK